jgi:hypothetical protein
MTIYITTAVVEVDSIDYTRMIWLACNVRQGHAQLSLRLVLHRNASKRKKIFFYATNYLPLTTLWAIFFIIGFITDSISQWDQRKKV